MMSDPVLLVQSGQTFDRAALVRALEASPGRDPLTGEALDGAPMISPNALVRSMIEDALRRGKGRAEEATRSAASPAEPAGPHACGGREESVEDVALPAKASSDDRDASRVASSRASPSRLFLSACARAVTGSRAAARVRTRHPGESDCATREATPRRPWRRRRRRGVGSASRRTRRPSRRRFDFPARSATRRGGEGVSTRDPPLRPSNPHRLLHRRRDASLGPSAARAASRAPRRARRASPRAGRRTA